MDSIVTIIAPVTDAQLAIFGIPLVWFATTVAAVVGWVNAVKLLLPNWIEGYWYPVIAALISGAYAWFTLSPDLLAVFVGTAALFLAQWGAWVGAKVGATAIGARGK